MSKQTFFKRLALGLVAALGVGLLSVPQASAVRVSTSLTLGSATGTANINDTASTTFQLKASATQAVATNSAGDSYTVRYTCSAPSGVSSCPAIKANQTDTSDTAGTLPRDAARLNAWTDISSSGWSESVNTASLELRSTVNIKAENFTTAGTYVYSFYVTPRQNALGSNGNLETAANTILSLSAGGTTVTWTVTVSALNTAGTALYRKYISADAQTAQYAKKALAASTDSAIVAPAGDASSPAIVGYAFVTTANSAGDTRVAAGSSWKSVDESLTVTMTGAGAIAQGTSTSPTSSISTLNSRSVTEVAGGETIVIYSNGTAGTGTITVTRSANGAAITTMTVTFVGSGASGTVSLSDTITPLAGTGVTIASLGTTNLVAQIKDSGGNLITSGTFYVFSSDTAVAGNVPTSTGATSYQTGHRCGNNSDSWNTTTKRLTCPVLLRDTGTATLTLRDSWTVTASTWTSGEVTVDIRGNVVKGIKVAFDKASYAPGEKAILTLTATDAAGKALATRASDTGRLSAVISTPVLSQITAASQAGTQGLSYTDTTFLGYNDTGVETRVVTMPSYGADVSYTVRIPGFGVDVAPVDVTATAKVVDPNATAIATAQAAADAATDAALEAIDAANAATDAANLAAEAADAATVASEEARDAADAATAAVEALATEVATLMAALKAQITTLANTVAKIAKKVKA